MNIIDKNEIISDEEFNKLSTRLDNICNYILMQNKMSLCVRQLIPIININLVKKRTTSYTNGTSISICVNHAKLPAKQAAYIVCHEICHILFMHIFRGKKLNHQIYNYATDYWINSMLETYAINGLNILEVPELGILLESGIHLNKSEDQIYEELLKELPPKNGQGQGKSKKQNKGSQGQNQGDDGDHRTEPVNLKEMKEALRNGKYVESIDDHDYSDSDGEAEDKISKKIENMKKNIGNSNDTIDRIIESFRTCKTHWEKELAKVFSSLCSQTIKYDYRKDCRRNVTEFFKPKRINRKLDKPRALIVFDTSGSISDSDIELFKGETLKVVYNIDITLMCIDTNIHNVHHCQTEDDIKNYKPAGGGGTDFTPAFDYAVEQTKKFDVIIYFTDGYGQVNNEIKYKEYKNKTLWLISEGGDDGYIKNFGKSIFLK